ncbi:MAG: HNH endonuclease [Candidatus Gastranaerophilales bacterium]|nr:HNH endonuclease [Candidatus Gastranaerophilales bacterium]
MEKEIWKSIENYENYMVSSKGRIAKILIGDSNGKGYRFIKFPDGKRIYIHQIVAKAFIPNIENHPIINHIDGNKLNNCVDNLEWCNYSHNCKEAYRLKLHIPKGIPVVQKTLDGILVKKWDSMREAERGTGICYLCISRCCKGILKTSGGYKWEFYEEID